MFNKLREKGVGRISNPPSIPVFRIQTSIERKKRLGSRCLSLNLVRSIRMTSLHVVDLVIERVLYSTSGFKTREKILTTT